MFKYEQVHIETEDEAALRRVNAALSNIHSRFMEYNNTLDYYFKNLSEAYGYVKQKLEHFYDDLSVDLMDTQCAIWDYEGIRSQSGPASVYFIENADTYMIKIGVANNVDTRLQALQTASGSELEVLGTIDFDTRQMALNAERWLHHYFGRQRKNPKRRKTEWFDGIIKKEVESMLKHKNETISMLLNQEEHT